ncbi:MAG TPA: SDR family NAD(P)-dependent oxidoreductase [Egibacteraceae bacterium]|jgi:benzil reductase ((S)-benzoin forming)|nr:SDR family NAD(P)-dependent oxidoreductase [Egibacteraceae bacterium]
MAETLVWVTGASRGIGAALVASVPYADARVIDISRSGPGTTPPDGSVVEHLRADLADPQAWAAVEAHLLAQLGDFRGRRAVFVHNAGTITPIGFVGEVDSVAYRRNVLLNSAAPQALGHAFLRAVNESGFSGQAHLVMLTSGAAQTPYEGWSSYSAGKAALDMWVRVAGAEQARRGGRTRVVAVAPGVVATRMQDSIRTMDEADFPQVAKFIDLHESGSLADPGDAAGGIWRLLERDLENGAVTDLRTLR